MAVGGFGMLTETGTVAEERNITISGGWIEADSSYHTCARSESRRHNGPTGTA